MGERSKSRYGMGIIILTEPNMHEIEDKEKTEIDITDANSEASKWVERIGKTANEICDDPTWVVLS